MSKKSLSLDDVKKTVEEQLAEDRKLLLEMFNDLKKQVVTTQDYAMHGLTLSKFGELLTKQTAQVIELAKLNVKEEKDTSDTQLNDEDRESVYELSKSKVQ